MPIAAGTSHFCRISRILIKGVTVTVHEGLRIFLPMIVRAMETGMLLVHGLRSVEQIPEEHHAAFVEIMLDTTSVNDVGLWVTHGNSLCPWSNLPPVAQ